MQRLTLRTPNKADENFRALAAMFPGAVTETTDENGEVVRAIDKDVLMQEISCKVVDGREERYQFTWPDKRKAVLLANAPTDKTLRPCRGESADFDTTENLYIEGDNLDALKLLQETYLGKIKMIYIDPPYNTGNDFVYEDDFAQDTQTYRQNSGQYDGEGNRLVQNTESNGRFHTDWLNMMYPRLRLARDLLSDDGVIFISIDDNEVENLKKICNEIFGEGNFVADLSVVNNLKGRNDKKYIARANDRLMMFVKSQDFSEHGLALDKDVLKEYNYKDQYGKYRLLELRKRGGADTKAERPNMYYPFYVNERTGEVSLQKDDYYTVEALPIKSNGVDGRWRWGKEKSIKFISTLYGKKVGNKYNVYEKDYLESDDGARRVRPKSVLSGAAYSSDVATKEYRALMNKIDFNNPKPIELIKDLVDYSIPPSDDSIILDFFSGSATTAHAVMQLNAEDGGNRRFIMVQLPEPCGEKSEAYKAGYNNICEIGKERIRRAGARIREENKGVDTGFRVLKIDSSNMKDVYYSPAEFDATLLAAAADNIKEDRTPEDLLFQVMLDLGILLSSRIEETTIAGKKAFDVADGYLIACFDSGVDEAAVTEIARQKPHYFVMRDPSGTSDGDSLITNFEQIFATYSPGTVRRVV